MDGLELIAEAAKRPTYDELMDRDPHVVAREERLLMIEHLRGERAAYELKAEEKEAKKEAA